MKIRNDFVTNSSSSSFIIAKHNLDEDQIEAIRQHDILGEKLGMEDTSCRWDIDENKNFITGFTFLDNFSMYDFFNNIGIPEKYVRWSEYAFNLNKEVYVPIKKKKQENEDIQDWRDILHSL